MRHNNSLKRQYHSRKKNRIWPNKLKYLWGAKITQNKKIELFNDSSSNDHVRVCLGANETPSLEKRNEFGSKSQRANELWSKLAIVYDVMLKINLNSSNHKNFLHINFFSVFRPHQKVELFNNPTDLNSQVFCFLPKKKRRKEERALERLNIKSICKRNNFGLNAKSKFFSRENYCTLLSLRCFFKRHGYLGSFSLTQKK